MRTPTPPPGAVSVSANTSTLGTACASDSATANTRIFHLPGLARRIVLFAAAIAVCGSSAWTARGQDVPSDLEVIATAGGLTPDAPYSTVRIEAGGQGSYARYPSADIDAEAEASSTFTVSAAELEQLWEQIQESDFFDLDASYAADDIVDRTFAELIVTANGTTHRVSTRNVAVEGFDDIVAVINDLTPGDDDLNYDTSPPIPFTSRDLCELPGKGGEGLTAKPGKRTALRDIRTGSDPIIIPAGGRQSGIDLITTAGGRLSWIATSTSAGGRAEAVAPDPLSRAGWQGVSPNSEPGDPSGAVVMSSAYQNLQNGGAHPGTVVAHRISLQEAVSLGIVTLSAKGGTIFGDGVSISINNATQPPSNEVTLTLYLELWGNGATPANVAAVKSAIENTWGGRTTSDGKTLHVNVVTRVAPGATAPPGTAGYHQIRLVTTDIISHVTGDAGVNQGVGGGVWETGSPVTDALRRTYAHEAGHLFGLPDRYNDYRKLADGNWQRESDGQTFTPAQMVSEIAPHKPNLTNAQILAKLNDGRQRVTLPHAGSENDLMAQLGGSPQQSDIDALAAQAGVIVEVRPGDILVNDHGEQNYVITRSEDVFVPAGGHVTLGGLYVACIDLSNSVPNEGTVFDVAPPLSEWRGIEAAEYLQRVVNYVDEQAFFCESVFSEAQSAIWRISDNHFSAFGYEPVETFLLEAGVDIGERILDFPRMTSAAPDDSTTTARVPQSLFVPVIASPTSSLLSAATTVSLSGSVDAPDGALQSATISWTLEAPVGSGASLTNAAGGETAFTADVRGAYRAMLQAEVTDVQSSTFALESSISFTLADAATETFETGSIRSGRPFYWETSGDNPWTVTDVVAGTGAYAAASGSIEDEGSTTLEVAFEQVGDEPFSFSYRVSSEAGFDFLEFFVDGELTETWSGETGWRTYSVDLGDGSHTVRWTYRKDDSVSSGADRAWIDDVFFPSGAVFTSIEGPDGGVLPVAFGLSQNYPNPFNPTTTIRYDMPVAAHVIIELYDAAGRRLRVLVDARQEAGRHSVQLDAHDLPSGVYLYRMRAGDFTQTQRLALVR